MTLTTWRVRILTARSSGVAGRWALAGVRFPGPALSAGVADYLGKGCAMFERIADWFRYGMDWEGLAISAVTVGLAAAFVGWVVFTFYAWMS